MTNKWNFTNIQVIVNSSLSFMNYYLLNTLSFLVPLSLSPILCSLLLYVSLLLVCSFAHLLNRFVYAFVCSTIWLLVVLAGAANLLHDALAEHEQYSPLQETYYLVITRLDSCSHALLFRTHPKMATTVAATAATTTATDTNRQHEDTHNYLHCFEHWLYCISWFISRAIEREFIQIMIVITCMNPAQRAHKHKILSKIFCKRHQFSVCIDPNWLDADLPTFDGWESSNKTTQLRWDETRQCMNGMERPTGKTDEKCNVHFQWKTSGERREKNVQYERKTEQCVYRNKQELFSLFNTQLIARRLHVTGAFHRINAHSLWTSLKPYPKSEHRPNFRVLAAEYEYDTHYQENTVAAATLRCEKIWMDLNFEWRFQQFSIDARGLHLFLG